MIVGQFLTWAFNVGNSPTSRKSCRPALISCRTNLNYCFDTFSRTHRQLDTLMVLLLCCSSRINRRERFRGQISPPPPQKMSIVPSYSDVFYSFLNAIWCNNDYWLIKYKNYIFHWKFHFFLMKYNHNNMHITR